MSKFGSHLFTIRASRAYAEWLRRRIVAHFSERYIIWCHDPPAGRNEYHYSRGGQA